MNRLASVIVTIRRVQFFMAHSVYIYIGLYVSSGTLNTTILYNYGFVQLWSVCEHGIA